MYPENRQLLVGLAYYSAADEAWPEALEYVGQAKFSVIEADCHRVLSSAADAEAYVVELHVTHVLWNTSGFRAGTNIRATILSKELGLSPNQRYCVVLANSPYAIFGSVVAKRWLSSNRRSAKKWVLK